MNNGMMIYIYNMHQQWLLDPTNVPKLESSQEKYHERCPFYVAIRITCQQGVRLIDNINLSSYNPLNFTTFFQKRSLLFQ